MTSLRQLLEFSQGRCPTGAGNGNSGVDAFEKAGYVGVLTAKDGRDFRQDTLEPRLPQLSEWQLHPSGRSHHRKNLPCPTSNPAPKPLPANCIQN